MLPSMVPMPPKMSYSFEGAANTTVKELPFSTVQFATGKKGRFFT